MIRRPPKSTPFPYATLFRSHGHGHTHGGHAHTHGGHHHAHSHEDKGQRAKGKGPAADAPQHPNTSTPQHPSRRPRSEEHTSELQSRQYLVCRLLLEKKKHPQHSAPRSRGALARRIVLRPILRALLSRLDLNARPEHRMGLTGPPMF